MICSGCKFCGGSRAAPFKILTKKCGLTYWHCADCGGISLSENDFLSIDAQRERYERHHNNLTDAGYRTFLCDFIRSCFAALPLFACNGIVDYGSGPSPALVQLLKLVSRRQRETADGEDGMEGADKVEPVHLDEAEGSAAGLEISEKEELSFPMNEALTFPSDAGLAADIDELARSLPPLPPSRDIIGWDPFFAAADRPEEGRASLVLCLEVAEHFERPLEGFAGLAACCAAGGFVAVGTLPLPDRMRLPDDFKGWWYKDDRTHVSFYTEAAAAACGAACGLEYVGKASSRIFLFQKPEDVVALRGQSR